MTEYTPNDRKNRVIMLPQMLEYHSVFLGAAFEASGYRFDTMHSKKPPVTEALKYISNDYCYPTVLILGQVLETIRQWEADGKNTDELAFMEPQAGGACRAGNIYQLIIEVLGKLGYDNIPVISLNFRGEEKHSGFHITPKLINNAATAVCCGDLLMLLYQQTKPYERHAGDTDRVRGQVETFVADQIRCGHASRMRLYQEILAAFARIETDNALPRRRVGVTGEIYIKFSSLGNHGLEDYLNRRGCEVYFGGFLNYIIYIADSEKRVYLLEHNSRLMELGFDRVIALMEHLQKQMYRAVRRHGYRTDDTFSVLRRKTEDIVSHDCITGDGWLIAAEVVQAIEQGCQSVLIAHPFGCLVSHVCERGILKNLKAKYKDVNIQTIEYDYDSSDTLRESRILLGLSSNQKQQ